MSFRAVPMFEKLPEEQFTQRVQFANVLAQGESIVSATVTAINRTSGANATAEILTGTPQVVAGSAVDYDVTAGQMDTKYLISIVATLNSGEKREQWIEMRVPKKML